MANSVFEWSSTPGDNDSIAGFPISNASAPNTLDDWQRNSMAQVRTLFPNVQSSMALDIQWGGTGGVTAAGARASLGLPGAGFITVTDAESPYTVLATSGGVVHLLDASAGDITVNLPDATGLDTGFSVFLQRVDDSANTVTIDAFGSQTINGAETVALNAQYEIITIQTNEVEWFQTSDGRMNLEHRDQTITGGTDRLISLEATNLEVEANDASQFVVTAFPESQDISNYTYRAYNRVGKAGTDMTWLRGVGTGNGAGMTTGEVRWRTGINTTTGDCSETWLNSVSAEMPVSGADYSANSLANDRSFTDVGMVKNLLTDWLGGVEMININNQTGVTEGTVIVLSAGQGTAPTWATFDTGQNGATLTAGRYICNSAVSLSQEGNLDSEAGVFLYNATGMADLVGGHTVIMETAESISTAYVCNVIGGFTLTATSLVQLRARVNGNAVETKGTTLAGVGARLFIQRVGDA